MNTLAASNSGKTWRVAIIGAGFVVQRAHIPGFQALPHVTIVALADVNEPRAQEVAQEAGIPHVYTDYQEMLRQERPDIVVVATPNLFHKPMTLAALEAGAHVLCEKPLALSYADAQEMMAAAQERGRVLTVGTHFRWSTPMQAAKAHADAGFFGEIYAARSIWNRRTGIPGYGSWFTNRDLAGAGALLDIGVHSLDRALHLMGYPQPVTVSGVTKAMFGPRAKGLGGWGIDKQAPNPQARFDVDDFAWAFIRFRNGAVLQLEVAWASHYPEEFLTQIYGTDGGGLVQGSEQLTLYSELNGQPVTIQPELPRGGPGSYARMIRDFVRYLDGDPQATIVQPQEALTVALLLEGILRSAEQGQEVALAEIGSPAPPAPK